MPPLQTTLFEALGQPAPAPTRKARPPAPPPRRSFEPAPGMRSLEERYACLGPEGLEQNGPHLAELAREKFRDLP